MFAVPQTPAVFAGPAVHSEEAQHPVVGTHWFVPGHSLNPALHPVPHFPAVHNADPFAAGVAHETHVVPQKLVLASDWQMPLQLCVPEGQVPLQALPFGMQPPAQSLLPDGQAGRQARPSQLTVPPPVGA